jgi:hypothetical protein
MDSGAGSMRWLIEALADAPEELNTELAKGQLVGRYRIVELLGRGGFGIVFKATDTELGREVALKLLRAARRDQEGEARLMREAQAMARLSDDNVITVYDVGTFEGGVFVAMELVADGTLRDFVAKKPAWREILEVMLRAGRGLEAAHKAGMIHRDFKPENILVGSDGRVHVTDFGLARLIDADTKSAERPAASLTRTGMLLGTPAYMAPEQIGGDASDVRSDVFSFCVTLYEALYRERPFVGDSLQSLRTAIGSNQVPQPLTPGRVPPRIRRVLLRGLRAAPDERFQTMSALLTALDGARGGDRRWLWIVVAAFVVLFAALAGVFFWPRPPSAPPVAVPSAPVRPVSQPSPPPVVVEPAPVKRGTLVVRVNADNARIELDGEVLAQSARTARVDVDAANDHQLTVSAPGYRPTTRRVRVGAAATVETEVVLRKPETKTAPKAAEDPNAAVDPYR